MHVQTPAGTTAITVSVCPRCGTIGKSGKSSCCGRGGSWFKNCGGAGNTKRQHTWHEGIQACKARSQFKAVIGQQLNGAQQQDIDSSSQGADMVTSRTVIAASKTFAHMSANTSPPMSDTTSIVTATYTPHNVLTTTPARTSITNIPSVYFEVSSYFTIIFIFFPLF